MTTDVTSLTGIVRGSSNTNIQFRPVNNVVPINQKISEQLNSTKPQAQPAEINRAASQVNDFVKQIGRNLEFSVHEGSGRIIITVRESDTGKIVRQIPPRRVVSNRGLSTRKS